MSKILTADEVKRHNTRKSVWMVIRNEVYDVTAFIDEHPGGEDPILEAAGQDATIAFEDVGHSEDAKAMLKKYKIGTLAPGEGCRKSSLKCFKEPGPPRHERRIQRIVVPKERRGKPCRPGPQPAPSPPAESGTSRWKYAVLALGVAILLGFAYKKYTSG